jgi:tetratricopeptide (TPR) repeat protein
MPDPKKSLPILGSEPDALTRLAAGDSASVIAELAARLQADPDDEVALLRLGAVYLAIQHLPEAEQALSRAVALDGDDVEARLLYADVLSRSKKHDGAAFQLVQARRLAPEDARVRRQLGIAFFDKGLLDKALAELIAASDLDPDDPRAPFVIGLIYDARKDPAGAIGWYRRAVALDPSSVDARCTLADALGALGEIAEAVTELEAAQRLDRTNTRIARNIEVLRHGLAELHAHRLLGKSEDELERSMMVKRGQLKRKGSVDGEVRYATAVAELLVGIRDGRIATMTLALVDPRTAMSERDDAFDVTVVQKDGKNERADRGTAWMLTFLREALGCPLTRAAGVYARLVNEKRRVSFAAASVAWAEIEIGERSLVGLRVEVS